MSFNGHRGNGISELNTRQLLYLELLNCSENSLRSLALNEGPLRTLIARSNSESPILIG